MIKQKNLSQVRYQVGDKNNNAKKVRNRITDEVYNTVKEASLVCNLTPSYLVQMLKGKIENTSNMCYHKKQEQTFTRAKW